MWFSLCRDFSITSKTSFNPHYDPSTSSEIRLSKMDHPFLNPAMAALGRFEDGTCPGKVSMHDIDPEEQHCSICGERYLGAVETPLEWLLSFEYGLSNDLDAPASSSTSRQEEPNVPEEVGHQGANVEEEFRELPIRLSCKHIFGRKCITCWLQKHWSCPMCRR